MKCPHCTVTVHIPWETGPICQDTGKTVWGWQAADCPACYKPIIKIGRGQESIKKGVGYTVDLTDLEDGYIVFPRVAQRAPLGDEVPKDLKADFLEACEVLSISPKASAALSRRVLQALLQEQGYTAGSLAQQVDAVLDEKDPSKVLPSSIRNSVDAIRNFGNFSAHRITDKTTLQVIDVDPEEAEWCLEIVERLFEHYYVQPAAAAEKVAALNAKLEQAGKPATKP